MLRRLQMQWARRRHFFNVKDFVVDAYARFLDNYRELSLPGRGGLALVRMAGHPMPFCIRLGTSDAFTVYEVVAEQEYSWALSAICADSVRNVIDLGGNIGISVRIWLESFGNLQAVVVVEPDEGNIGMLRRNLAEARVGSSVCVQVVQACAAAKEWRVVLNRDAGFNALRMQDVPSGGTSLPTVPTCTVEQLIESPAFASGPIDLLKCDIEGSEVEVMRAAQKWIGRVRNMVVEVHHPYTAEALVRDLEAAGSRFREVRVSPHRAEVVGLFGNALS